MVWYHVPACEPSMQYQVNTRNAEYYTRVKILCAAPTAGELMKWIRAKHPDAEITSRCVWPGAAWIVRYQDDSFKNAHGDTEIAALAALVLEVAA